MRPAQSAPMPLTDPACRNASCPLDKARARFTDAQGLYLEVLPTGGKYWRLKYRYAGKEKRLGLGVYPEVPLAGRWIDKAKQQARDLSGYLKGARDKRDEARRLLADGIDPSVARQQAKVAQRAAVDNSFESVARAWHAQWKATRSDSHVEYVLRRLEADVFPEIGHVAVADLKAIDFTQVAKKIAKRGALDIAKRSLQTCGQVMRYAVAHALAERNPLSDVKPGDVLESRKKVNYAHLEAKELPELLRKMQAYDGAPYTRFALQLVALTFVRTSELIEATWDEFDLDAAEWRIPAERMKMRTPHIVPLSTQAVDALRCLHELKGLSERVFPGERDHDRPMSNNTILKALERMGYKHRMTGHGFRSVASTMLHELGFRHDIIELQLAHQERNAVSASYNHATYLRERRKMMQQWADHLDALRRGAKVVPFKAA